MTFFRAVSRLHNTIKRIGVHEQLDATSTRKLYIFNQLNFLGFVMGITLPLAALTAEGYLPVIAWVVAFSPAVISFSVLYLNYKRQYKLSMFLYFTLYPLTTALVYAGNIDVGIELFFIFYSVLSVFFLQDIKYILMAFMLSAICYFSVYIFHQNYDFKIVDINFGFYVVNHLLAISFIFVGLFLIKKENTSYQQMILGNNEILKKSQFKILQQKQEIADQVALLQKQTSELEELNGVKDKLFSIISHDLRTPIYSLRNLFTNMEKYDLPGEEIKVLLPDIIVDINYTTNLMENLLQWAKSQMSGSTVNMQLIEVSELIIDVKKLLRLQAESKKIYISSKIEGSVYIFADKDMMNLVLRNLVSNAIKFTPADGSICIGAEQKNDTIELFVQDTGMGIPADNINKLFKDEFYTTKGTSNESGTGLGLILCKEFLRKNGGDISVQSEQGKGSRFICNLPIP
jgi:two-component system, sensor histidine kinase and response regulator